MLRKVRISKGRKVADSVSDCGVAITEETNLNQRMAISGFENYFTHEFSVILSDSSEKRSIVRVTSE